FLNRPMSLSEDGLARTYLLRNCDGESEHKGTLGYMVLNPWFREGRVAGDLLDILRVLATRQWGGFYAAVASLSGELLAEGHRELSLGFCPLFRATEGQEEFGSRGLAMQVGWLGRYLSEVPYVRRLREQKMGFPGRECRRYFASGSPVVFGPFL